MFNSLISKHQIDPIDQIDECIDRIVISDKKSIQYSDSERDGQ